MTPTLKLKQLILVLGDIIALYLALALTLLIRYQEPFSSEAISTHFEPFSIVFIIWILVFYIIGLYEIRSLKNTTNFIRKLITALVINIVITVSFFYFVTAYGITPKTNLFIFLALIFLLEYAWRTNYNNFLTNGVPTTKVLIIGSGLNVEYVASAIKNSPQLGYELFFLENAEEISQTIISQRIDLVVVPNNIKKNSKVAQVIYKNLITGTSIIDLSSFYEIIFNKVPISELQEFWFLENLINRQNVYDFFRLPLEILLAVILGIILLPISILIGLFIKLTSKGPVVFKQTRVGELGKTFIIYKFRSMKKDAEANGAQWATSNDQRVTFIGKVLRFSHLDEIPQLINIIKGDLSFVGPRPERPEFTEDLKKAIPYYELRHVVRPGITGWAQLNYRYGASVEDAYEKLQYDLYYIKNRSFWLDLSIIIKTVKLLFTRNS